ncbi:hypothetical protein NNC19_10405 [Clostridium sp. SHJSY1]|uniref:hypothetical protein n=1 Tax=Clostridium sp. SHJSY1 TaxID=2942483 RepID=UPI0028763B7B|nr:hypothetical protein [Clostridium sp. SHJSY1]MDS0526092.1 hypothetical protein [Clostridium sp. SHJSY1]
MKKIMLFIMIVATIGLVIKATTGSNTYTEDKNYNINEKIFKFLQSDENRKYVYSKAIKLNKGNSANTCVYFLAELLKDAFAFFLRKS